MIRTVEISTTDTREREPLTGRVVPGSGDPVPCSCCGRAVVVHVRVISAEVNGFDSQRWTAVGASRVIGKACAARHCVIPRAKAKELVRRDEKGWILWGATI